MKVYVLTKVVTPDSRGATGYEEETKVFDSFDKALTVFEKETEGCEKYSDFEKEVREDLGKADCCYEWTDSIDNEPDCMPNEFIRLSIRKCELK